jgi:acetyltransferase
VDLLGDADASRFKQALEVVAVDPETDGILTILTPQAVTDPTAIAAEICECARATNKPILASWMGGFSVADGEAVLNAAHIPTFKTPDDAARAFALMWQYNDNLRALYETPDFLPPYESNQSPWAVSSEIIRKARIEKRTLLAPTEAGRILRAYGIPVIESRTAETEEGAVDAATALGFPVVVKLHSNSITHKSDIGGVILNVGDADAVRSAWRTIRQNVAQRAHAEDFQRVTIQPMIQQGAIELILGSSVDSQFGPTIMFGSGGKFVEVYKDTVIGLPPLNSTLARRLIERTRVSAALKGVRGAAPVNIAALEQVIAAFSQLVVEHPSVAEIDINPLLAGPDEILAIDFRIILHPHNIAEADLPRPAIRPYPTQYISDFMLKDGTPVTLRPIRPEDEALMLKFHQTLSDRSVYMRYFIPFKLEQRIAHARLSRGCLIDYDREMALVAEHRVSNGQRHIVGIARLSRSHHADEAEFSVLVSDEWQQQGLGSELLRRIVKIGRDARLKKITGTILEDNCAMQRLAIKCGFALRHVEGECVAEMIP